MEGVVVFSENNDLRKVIGVNDIAAAATSDVDVDAAAAATPAAAAATSAVRGLPTPFLRCMSGIAWIACWRWP